MTLIAVEPGPPTLFRKSVLSVNGVTTSMAMDSGMSAGGLWVTGNVRTLYVIGPDCASPSIWNGSL